jgi:hypothetical protein
MGNDGKGRVLQRTRRACGVKKVAPTSRRDVTVGKGEQHVMQTSLVTQPDINIEPGRVGPSTSELFAVTYSRGHGRGALIKRRSATCASEARCRHVRHSDRRRHRNPVVASPPAADQIALMSASSHPDARPHPESDLRHRWARESTTDGRRSWRGNDL